MKFHQDNVFFSCDEQFLSVLFLLHLSSQEHAVDLGMSDHVIRWSCYIITRLFPLIPTRNSKAAQPTPSPQCFLSINNRSDNFTGSSFKTTPGFLLRKVEVKGYRTIANSMASCLSGILELHREVWVGGGTSLCARPTHF